MAYEYEHNCESSAQSDSVHGHVVVGSGAVHLHVFALSLLFCMLSIISSSMWIYYSVQMNDTPLVMRSSTEITLLFLSALYIIKNKVSQHWDLQEHHIELR